MSSSPPALASTSQTSLSPSSSTTHHDVPLQTLVSHLLAAKRSLSSINTVWRANEIVTSARAALEESLVLSAQAEFLQKGLAGQIKGLEQLRGGIETLYRGGQRDFKSVIKTLDAANARLESTMDILRSTMVEAAFRPSDEEPRSLLDFVDEQGVEAMRDSLKDSIRETRKTQSELDSSILSFDEDIRALESALTPIASTETPIPSHLQTLESHAQEMASLLSSLVSHFDLCVNAIRHTEGGYAAVQKAASSQPPGSDPVSVSGVIQPMSESPAEASISDEERHEMFDVLEKDAAQVEDVVMELREFLVEMEQKHEGILAHVATLAEKYENVVKSYEILEGVGDRLPGYVAASQDFKFRWAELKEQIMIQSEELEIMRLFYENYSQSYDSLILEICRRKSTEEKMRSIMEKAMEQINKIYEKDREERVNFRLDVGDYLPVDLFPGINNPAPKWMFEIANKEVESVPELEEEAIVAAGKRERSRKKGD